MSSATSVSGMAAAGQVAEPRWELYRLLSDATRVRLLALTAHEELAVSELAELLRQGQPKVSRHASSLRDAGLLSARKQGTWVLLRLTPSADDDPVIADALAAGRDSLERDGTLARVADVVAARDGATREFFARGGRPVKAGPPEELAAYLAAVAPLIERRQLAVDAGTGDGALLEVLAPLFEQVVALDRAEAQLDLARQRVERRGFDNVIFVGGEIDGPEVRAALERAQEKAGRSARSRKAGGADAVFAARVLHHAPSPAKAMGALVELARPARGDQPGGAVLVLDYQPHRDEALRDQQADLWLGFEEQELMSLARRAGLQQLHSRPLPPRWCGEGPDRHLGWHLVSGRRGERAGNGRARSSRGGRKKDSSRRGS
jgi:ArsR family transcriptional regulator